MPPATDTEAPALRDERIGKHLAKAREYWLKCPAYLKEGDLCQAGEKAWGAVAQMTKAVASHRGWRHFRHADLLAAARQIADESEIPATIRESINIVRTMHTNFYEVDLDLADTEPVLSQRWKGRGKNGGMRSASLVAMKWRRRPEGDGVQLADRGVDFGGCPFGAVGAG